MNRWVGRVGGSATNAKTRRVIHYWATVLWLSVGTVIWLLLRNMLWFVGFMSLYTISITHLAGWAAETPVEPEDEAAAGGGDTAREARGLATNAEG
jgi:hypothetical protein